MPKRSSTAVVPLVAALLAACSSSQIDPSPPLDDEHHTEADNPLLEGNEDTRPCGERLERARAHVDRALERGIRGCAMHGDCTTILPRTSCFDACPQPVAIAEEADTARAVGDAEERWCEGFREECPDRVIAPDGCPEGDIRCVEGECRLVVP